MTEETKEKPDCANCGREFLDHRADDLRCPIFQRYSDGVVRLRDYMSETYYRGEK